MNLHHKIATAEVERARVCFEKWTEGLQMTVALDQGLYRHLRFKAPGSFDGFDLITWPGRLTIDGGHGTWTFARVEDMFEFFRQHPRRRTINPGYWSEKLLGGKGSGRAAAKGYSEDVYRAQVIDHTNDVIRYLRRRDRLSTDAHVALVRAVWADLLDKDPWGYPGDHEQAAREALDKFTHTVRINGDEDSPIGQMLGAEPDYYDVSFEDTWEWDLDGWDFHFLWSCWATVKGIAMYDEAKAAAA